jgi:four helix bundle protein
MQQARPHPCGGRSQQPPHLRDPLISLTGLRTPGYGLQGEGKVSRDHRKLRVFQLADELVVAVYKWSARLPPDERFGLISQIRRAAVSVPTNLVEGCARRTTHDYLHFVTIALASASEVRYLIDLAARLHTVAATNTHLEKGYDELIRALQGLLNAFEPEARSPKRAPAQAGRR